MRISFTDAIKRIISNRLHIITLALFSQPAATAPYHCFHSHFIWVIMNIVVVEFQACKPWGRITCRWWHLLHFKPLSIIIAIIAFLPEISYLIFNNIILHKTKFTHNRNYYIITFLFFVLFCVVLFVCFCLFVFSFCFV